MENKKKDKNELENQVERGSLFTHSALSRQSARLNEIESFLYGIVEAMTVKGIISPDEFKQVVEQVRNEMIENDEMAHPGLALRVDSEGDNEYIPVNCSERIHVCQAVCCKLDFALSAEEVEGGIVRWDLGRPYMIRQEKNCYCTHNNSEDKKCSIYDDRPTYCKKYDCTNDPRIWKDFEKMELNQEWIDDNIKEKKFQFQGGPMFTINK